MAKKTIVVKKPAAKKPVRKSGLSVVIDYPEAHEIVRPGHYSIRLTVPGAGQAQVRFDGGEWNECRESLGHFWHDWAPQAGRVCVEARARAGSGRWSPMAEREVVVTAEGPERDGSIFA
ncbi:MAG: hypothetical protein A2V88_11365 [Elusimicrobia bacterium RBG_16_66_12]|nr:MAG: hypothetical protein A2V88_11365 [Elusimicrobia bacterium RBG_16_66_12]